MDRAKYPRTPHLPFSPGATSDDKVLKDYTHMVGREVVVTEKLDGENTSLYAEGLHARSLDSRHHESRDWVKAFHASRKHLIDQAYQICGENMYAQHSLGYDNLESYFYGFTLLDACMHPGEPAPYGYMVCSWDDTLAKFQELGITSVPQLYRGKFDYKLLVELAKSIDTSKQEGFVVRLAQAFSLDFFDTSVAKWVRPNHVQTDEHWLLRPVAPNKLRSASCQNS